MKAITRSQNFPGFIYPANELAKFKKALNLFTILLKNGSIVHFEPKDGEAFYKWLVHFEIQDIGEK